MTMMMINVVNISCINITQTLVGANLYEFDEHTTRYICY